MNVQFSRTFALSLFGRHWRNALMKMLWVCLFSAIITGVATKSYAQCSMANCKKGANYMRESSEYIYGEFEWANTSNETMPLSGSAFESLAELVMDSEIIDGELVDKKTGNTCMGTSGF